MQGTASIPAWRKIFNIGCPMIGIFLVVNILFGVQEFSVPTTPSPLHFSAPHIVQGNSSWFHKQTAPVQNIYMVKIHKAGSTTLQNILYRFGVANDLKIAAYDADFGMPFPDIASPKYLFEDVKQKDFKPYNLMVDHAVYSKRFPAEYMEKNVFTVASLREPMSYLKSAFSFFHLKKSFNLHSKEPVLEFLSKGPETFRTKVNGRSYNWTKNLQLFSFGYDNRYNNNPSDIKAFIQTMIEPNIHHMILLDYFDEGMVLLKRKLNWNIKDIVYKVLWSTSKAKKMPVQTDEKTVESMHTVYKEFSLGDYILYDYYKEKVEAEIKAQGNIFQKEVSEYQAINRDISQFCSTVCSKFNRTLLAHAPKTKIVQFLSHLTEIPPSKHGFHDGFTWSFSDCALMGFFTFDYQIAIRVHQFARTCSKTHSLVRSKWQSPTQNKYSKNWCTQEQHVIYSFPWRLILDTFLKKCK